MRTTLCLAALLVGASASAEGDASPPPLKPGITEGVETRLVQFEVRVSRKGAPVSGLTAADFDIELGGKPLTKFTVDDMCVAALSPVPGTQGTRAGSYILYFDEPELTVEGRHRAIEVARLVVPALLARGHDVMILRNGDALRTDTKWTHDPAVVSAALDRIAADPGNGDSLRAEAEQLQAERLLDRLTNAIGVAGTHYQTAMRDTYRASANSRAAAARQSQKASFDAKVAASNGPAPVKAAPIGPDNPDSPLFQGTSALADAQRERNEATSQLLLQFEPLLQDELRRVERDMERLSLAVRYLALRESPKGLVYFADTLRRDPGEAILWSLDQATQFARRLDQQEQSGQLKNWRTKIDLWDADGAFQSLVQDASTYGVRFYSVEGRGLSMPSDWVRSSQDTIASMALDTGGLFFLNGIAPASIAASVAADQSCWYLVSFAPSGWDTDRPLGLGVWPKSTGLRVLTRSSLVIPSRATLTQTRLVAAHFEDPTLQARPLSLSLYPIGGTTKSFQVLAQVRLPESDAPSTREALWDIGFDVVSQGEIVAHTSAGVTWRGNGAPPVYQTTLSLPAGPYEIVAVAHETATDSIRAGRINGTWPLLPADPVTLSLPALAQPQSGGLVLEGKVKATGIIVRGEGNPVDPRASVAFVTAVCVERSPGAVFRAERRIVGETEVSFEPMTLAPDQGNCVQIRDLVAAHSFGAGRLTYFVRIFSGEEEIASQELPFDVADVSVPAAEVSAPRAK